MYSNGRLMRWLRKGLLLILLLTVTSGSSEAKWNVLLYENFEGSISSWPWAGNVPGQRWQLASTSTRNWGVESNAIYYPSAPDYIQSIWCAGIPNDLQAGVDLYPANFRNIAYWGAFNLSNAVASFGTLQLFADLESNSTGTGDNFLIVTTTQPTSPSTWDTLYVRNDAGTLGEWRMIHYDMSFVREHGTGDTISLIGETTNRYLGVVFYSDTDQNRGYGAFVDDVSFGYDDGLFDFDRRQVTLEDPDDEMLQYTAMYVGTPVKIRTRFVAHGNYLSEEVTHILTIDGEVHDSVRTAWQGSTFGTSYEVLFNTIYTPTETGMAEIICYLDFHGEQDEYTEANNNDTLLVEIFPENAPPAIEFFQPAEGGAIATGNTFNIIYQATNTPVGELAHVSFYYDDDQDMSELFPIFSGLGRVISGEQDTVTWALNAVPDGEYYILAILQDYFHEPRHAYAPGTVTVQRSSAPEDGAELPKQFQLVSVYPNPFNPTVEVHYEMPFRADVSATWYSVDGRQVARQAFANQMPGRHSFNWTPHNLPSGVYLCTLDAGRHQLSFKVVYMK